MSVLGALLGRGLERRSGVANPVQWLIDKFRGALTASGVDVTPTNSLEYPPIWAAVNIIAGAVGFLPLITYKRLEGGKDRAPDHRAYELLHDRANPYMDALTFRETLQGHALTWGNGYAEIERDRGGRAVYLWPLRPDRTRPVLKDDGRLFYEVRDAAGDSVFLPAENTLHIKGLGSNGFIGLSPIRMAMEAIGVGKAAERYGGSFFGNSASPGGVLEHPSTMSKEGHDRLLKEWNVMHQGLDNAYRAALLEEGMKWHEIGLPPKDAQFLETRKFSVIDVARMYQIPPHMLGDLDRATFSNIEHQGIEFVTMTLMRWLRRWELECNWKLFSTVDRGRYYAEFLVDSLLRGDTKSRYEAYAVGRNWGWLSANDIRERENMNPIDGGDVYLSPMNMLPADQLGKAAPIADPPALDPPAADQSSARASQRSAASQSSNGPSANRMMAAEAAAHQELCEDICRRLATKEINAVTRLVRHGDQEAQVTDFYARHEAHIRDILRPAVAVIALSLPGASTFDADDYVRRAAARAVNDSREFLSEHDGDAAERFGPWRREAAERMAVGIVRDILGPPEAHPLEIHHERQER